MLSDDFSIVRNAIMSNPVHHSVISLVRIPRTWHTHDAHDPQAPPAAVSL